MEFSDIFIFNNVKPDLEIILCQPNQVVSKIKVLSLYTALIGVSVICFSQSYIKLMVLAQELGEKVGLVG